MTTMTALFIVGGIILALIAYLIIALAKLSAANNRQWESISTTINKDQDYGKQILDAVNAGTKEQIQIAGSNNVQLTETIGRNMQNLNQDVNNTLDIKTKGMQQMMESSFDKTNTLHKDILEAANKMSSDNATAQKELRNIVTDEIKSKTGDIQAILESNFGKTDNLHKDILDSITKMTESNSESQKALAKSLSDSLMEIRQMNEKKLDEINQSVSDKLDKSLNERLDSSFKQIGEQLGSLYESLGELNKLSSGVTDLNQTLSNVKTRGIWGEAQLRSILENTMTPAQYEENIATKKNSSDRVEFAIKIPSKADDNDFIYLPIDSKFPSDIYNKIVDARNDASQVVAAQKELEQRIKTEARTIRDKYLNPPATTDFAIMFLPTESLYAEVLRIAGLTEWCQTNCKIIISGPTTITALLNSLRVGFSNLTLNKKTQEVIKVLKAVKTQYSTLDELIGKTQKKLTEAVNSTDALKKRTDMIQKRMKNIDALESSEAAKILAIGVDEEE